MTTGWQRRCPNNHTAVRRNNGDPRSGHAEFRGRYYCETCGTYFEELRSAPSSDEPAWKGEVVLK